MINHKMRRPLGRAQTLAVAAALTSGTLGLVGTANAQDMTDLGVLESGVRSTAYVVSGDGAVVGGFSSTVGPGDNRAFLWDAVDGMVNLGVLAGGTSSEVRDINFDGSVSVGNSASPVGTRAFRWEAGNMVSLGVLAGGSNSSAKGVSADGSVVVGFSSSARGDRAFRWDAANGMVSLGALTPKGGISSAEGVNADGTVVVGYSSVSFSGNPVAFRWDDARGMVGLGILNGGTQSLAYGVSDDGSVVVGVSDSADGSRAFRWDAGNGMVSLGTLAGGTKSAANAISGNGLVVVGDSSSTNGRRAFRWDDADGMVDLGTLAGGTYSIAYGVNDDGSIIVGASDSLNGERAFIWQGVMLDLVNTQVAIGQSAADLAAATEARNGAIMFSLGRELEVARGGGAGFAKGALGSNLPMAIRLEGSISANSSVNDSAFAGVSAAIGLGEKLTFGGFVQTGREQNSYNTIGQSTNQTGYGLYLRSRAADKSGFTWKLAAAVSAGDATITREALLLNTEAGTGLAAISAYAASVEFGYGINRGKVNFTPFLRISGGSSSRAGYTEDATITFPVTYDALTETQIMATLGVDGVFAVNPRNKFRFGAGLEIDLARSNTAATGTSAIPGMTVFSIAAPTVINSTRAYASLGYSYDLGENSTVSLDVSARQSAFVSSLTYSASLGFEVRF